VFIFCLIWAVGGVLDDKSRILFNTFLKQLVEKNGAKCAFPTRSNVFDFYPDMSRGSWTPWCDGYSGVSFTNMKAIEQQMIPTNESAATLYLSRMLVTHKYHVLVQGPETSKTLVANTLFEDVLNHSEYDCHVLPLASCSTPNNISSFIQSFLHRRQGKFGPLPNHSALFLIDNLGSVKPEIYGAQPALELLRQFIDYGGWFCTAPVEFLNIIGTTLLAAMGVPGGGLYSVPDRLARHFFLLHMPKYSMSTSELILSGLFANGFARHSPAIKDSLRILANATIEVFGQCQQNLLPIPSKLHYVFNLRNIVRVVKGMLLVSPSFVQNEQDLLKSWYHEMSREFFDRFNSMEDREWFSNVMNEATRTHFKQSWQSINPSGFIMFNDFADNSQTYKEVKQKREQLLQSCVKILEDRNRDATKVIDIVLFQEALDHLSALSRIFSMQRGNALLVGAKSSGRKSLVRLALHMGNIDPFEIAITRTYGFGEWREDLKNLLKQCGKDDVPTGFIITDVQIIMTRQLEDLSNLLIDCEIPHLFARDEMEGIKAELAQMEMLSDVDYWELFMERVRRNLHIILVFSPFGSIFKDSMLSFTALRNETTIDWYMPWSQDALESVAGASLGKAAIGDPAFVHSIVTACVKIHKSVEEMSQRFLKETKRFTACTPSRYFELLTTFQRKLKKKEKETTELIEKYENGCEKIKVTRAQIQTMSEQLD
jgi:hypothetical protein